MEKLIILLGLSLFLIPVKITYTHGEVCECNKLGSNCPVNRTETITLLGWLTTPEEIIEQVKFFN